ncbi:DUF4229 domain-containing protein [Streptomyces sp. NPDC058864]
MLRYSLMRLGLFAACFLAIWGLVYVRALPAGLGDSNLLWVMLLALVISAPLSFVVLRGVREEASVQVATRVERTKANLAASAAQEDEADDASRAAAQSG